ncbi:N-acetylmuramoyl-L-alanine amidase [bacterium]|nr:N-acetylmuramoyl-L-alanine amidase [bacterium]
MDERAIKKVVLDSGHGGEDPGTIANGITEKDYTLKISKYIHNRLDEMGVPNKMTRTSDVTLTPSERPKKVQSFYGNGSDVIVVSNHINAGGGDGAEIIYALRNNDTFARKIANEFENAGQNVRKYYQRRLPSNPAKDYYYIMRDTPNNETVIVEYGFADSTGDDISQLKNNWEKLAEAVTKAIVEYAGGKYVAPIDSNYYTVKSGDSLWSISRKLGITVDELKSANNLSSNLLSVGQNLIIPGKEAQATGDEYVVKKGDTLYSIARKYNTSVDNLKSINNITTDSLAIGQIIKLPSTSSTASDTYIVKKGDSLYSIARTYNTSVDKLKEINNLTSNALAIGQVLKLPSSNASEKVVYTVKKGDSLYSIAREYGTTVDAIKKLNNITSNTLSIGQKLLLS